MKRFQTIHVYLILKRAKNEAKRYARKQAGSEHLLLAMMRPTTEWQIDRCSLDVKSFLFREFNNIFAMVGARMLVNQPRRPISTVAAEALQNCGISEGAVRKEVELINSSPRAVLDELTMTPNARKVRDRLWNIAREFDRRQLPMWHRYRVELYPHFGQTCGIKDEFGNDLQFPAAFRKSRREHKPKGIVRIKEGAP